MNFCFYIFNFINLIVHLSFKISNRFLPSVNHHNECFIFSSILFLQLSQTGNLEMPTAVIYPMIE